MARAGATTKGSTLARRETDELNGSPTRARVVAAATELFREVGYGGCTVEDIRLRAEVSKATFYFYFASKDDVFLDVGNAVLARHYESLFGARWDGPGDPYSKVVSTNARYLHSLLLNRRILHDYFSLTFVSPRFREERGKYTKQFQSRIERHIERLLDAGEISGLDSKLTAISLSGMVEIVCFRFFSEAEIVGLGSYSIESLLCTISKSWYRSLYGKPHPPDFDYEPYIAEVERELGPAALAIR
jgi:AcrR family transcriptional regulator